MSDLALQEYIQKMKASGVTQQQVREQLLASGWSPDSVNQALEEIFSNLTSITSPTLANPVTPAGLSIPTTPVTAVASGGKDRTFITLVASSVALVIIVVALLLFKFNTNPETRYLEPTYSPSLTTYDSSEPTPAPSPEEIPTLAPPGSTSFTKQNYRTEKISIQEAQEVGDRVAETLGTVIMPKDMEYAGTEVHRGILIRWTIGQPIPPERMAWIKEAIDILPDFFIKDHPVTSITSASEKELSLTHSPEAQGAGAYASGTNIFLTNRFLKDTTVSFVPKEEAVKLLLHEWTHVVQYYEMVQVFTEKYLSIPGNYKVAFGILPFNKEYAKQAGWVFEYDEYGDSSYAKLGTDENSQKMTEYGKTSYIEDMAESAPFFMLCQADQTSPDRIAWWEKTTSTMAADYCR